MTRVPTFLAYWKGAQKKVSENFLEDRVASSRIIYLAGVAKSCGDSGKSAPAPPFVEGRGFNFRKYRRVRKGFLGSVEKNVVKCISVFHARTTVRADSK